MHTLPPDTPPTTLTILRAAAAEDDQAWHLPRRGPDLPAPLTGSDALATLAINAAAFLLTGLPPESLANLGLIIGTTLGCLETDRIFDRSRRDSQGRYASPAAFSRTLPSTIPAEIARAFHLTGPMLVLNSGAGSAALALRRAAAWMHYQQLDLCLAGAFDFTGAAHGFPESCRAALLLIASGGTGVGELTMGSYAQPDLTTIQDESLTRLIRGIRIGGEITLGAGVGLTMRSSG